MIYRKICYFCLECKPPQGFFQSPPMFAQMVSKQKNEKKEKNKKNV